SALRSTIPRSGDAPMGAGRDAGGGEGTGVVATAAATTRRARLAGARARLPRARRARPAAAARSGVARTGCAAGAGSSAHRAAPEAGARLLLGRGDGDAARARPG